MHTNMQTYMRKYLHFHWPTTFEHIFKGARQPWLPKPSTNPAAPCLTGPLLKDRICTWAWGLSDEQAYLLGYLQQAFDYFVPEPALKHPPVSTQSEYRVGWWTGHWCIFAFLVSQLGTSRHGFFWAHRFQEPRRVRSSGCASWGGVLFVDTYTRTCPCKVCVLWRV